MILIRFAMLAASIGCAWMAGLWGWALFGVLWIGNAAEYLATRPRSAHLKDDAAIRNDAQVAERLCHESGITNAAAWRLTEQARRQLTEKNGTAPTSREVYIHASLMISARQVFGKAG